ncbi:MULTISPECIES: MFS transporter [Paenibacillus]|uniref:Putative MFS family arabinose efflux permease n=1 Tax=Paenibacillus pabuli TaxID=1472 RepID=A0A855Y331_9BACL|nr:MULTISPECIES: MFS transporter [Paenibacillus]PWW36081.1 putative MFS family arabinose efflux permease [Paenibacillus pabuli]PXW03160.1 putative MFS family arabinose efflux permease [Paenibacillus taichungensis]
MTRKRENLLILTLTLVSFVLGTTEYVIVGVLKEIETYMKVSLAAAGALVSGFAIAYAIGTPFAVAFLAKITRRNSILIGFAVVLALNVLTIFSTTFYSLMVIRIVSAVACGLTISLSISIASDAVNQERRGEAIAWILGGFSIANVLGVPLGTFIGQHLNWSMTFVVTACIGAVPFLFMFRILPRQTTTIAGSFSDQMALFMKPRILLACLIPVLGNSCIFVIFTYITPLLGHSMGIPARWISAVLLIYGACSILSNWIGAKIAKGDFLPKLKWLFVIQAAVFLGLSFTVSHLWLGLAFLFLIGCLSSSMSAASQLYLFDVSGAIAPNSRPFASTLLPVAANVGIALGSGVGGLAVNLGGVKWVPPVAVILALMAFVITAICQRSIQLKPEGATTPKVDYSIPSTN